MFIVYKVKNKINNKIYIGMSGVSLEKRINNHLYTAKTKRNPTSIFHKAIRKYGIKNFTFKVISKHRNRKTCVKYEIKNIKKFNSKAPNGYNLTIGGEGCVGRKLSTKEIKTIILRTQKAVIRNDGTVFKSITEAANKTKNTNIKNISACVYGKRASCGGFTWKFLKNDPFNIRQKIRKEKLKNKERTIFKRRKVKCLTNNKIYDSISSAARDLNCQTAKISAVCRKQRKTHKNMKFVYVKD